MHLNRSEPPEARHLAGVSSELLGGRDLDRLGRRLRDAQRVAERVAKAAVDAVEVLGRLLGELDALREQLLVGLAAVLDVEDHAVAAALGNQLADEGGGLL